ncbi:hypothetical protein [Spartinivicinus ruber]|uniref:hypothetical protein n=1 Tax=Spartinivicinus ruber TaxID=2683272 RepID=UPI0013D70086|nr:hypothetical protein [Spartinivicinus ruber]
MKKKLLYIGVPILTASAILIVQNFIGEDNTVKKKPVTNDVVSVEDINKIKKDQSIKKRNITAIKTNTEVIDQDSTVLPEAEVNAIKAAISDLPSQVEKPANLELWSSVDSEMNTNEEGIRSQSFNVNPAALEQLSVGQSLTIELPNQHQLTATINNTTNGAYSESWNAKVDNNSPVGSVSITKGKEQSIVYINSEQGEYEAYIDNKTGKASLVYLADVRAKANFKNDTVEYQPQNLR